MYLKTGKDDLKMMGRDTRENNYNRKWRYVEKKPKVNYTVICFFIFVCLLDIVNFFEITE